MNHDKSTAALRKAAQFQQDNLAWARWVRDTATERLPCEIELAEIIIEAHADQGCATTEAPTCG